MIDNIYKLLESLEGIDGNDKIIEEIRECLDNENYKEALEKIKLITATSKTKPGKKNAKILENDSKMKKSSVKKKKIKKEDVEINEEKAKDEELDDNVKDYKVENNEIDDEFEEDGIEEDVGIEIELDETEENEKDNENEENPVVDEETTEGIYPKELSNAKLEHLYIGMLLDNPKLISKYYFTFAECFFEDDMALNNYKSVLFTEGAKFTPERAKQGFNFAKETRIIT